MQTNDELHAWAAARVRALLVRVLMTTAREFSLLAHVEARR